MAARRRLTALPPRAARVSSRRRLGASAAAWALGLVAALLTAAAPGAEPLDEARRALWRGQTTEALERYTALADSPAQPAAVLGQARALVALGRRDEALAKLNAALRQAPDEASLLTERANLHWDRGDWEAATTDVTAALAENPDHAPARWLQAELHLARGELAEAAAACEALVRWSNGQPELAGDDALAVGRAAAQHARWNRLSEQFRFLVNEYYPAQLAREPDFWPAAHEAGLLFLEKYNQAEATRQFQAALAINPGAVEVYAALARQAVVNYDLDQAERHLARAWELNPEDLPAAQTRADLALANFDLPGARRHLERARALNPYDEGTLGRLAAVEWLEAQAPTDGAVPALVAIEAEVLARNPAAGNFYFTLATRLEERRQFPEAERYFQEARRRMPQLVGPAAGLGLLYLRLGREDEARAVLAEAAAADPFHVRVNNSLEVLEVLSGYETLESEHFRVRFDPAHDRLLAEYLLEHLETIRPRLAATLGHTPREPVLFEILNRAKNTEAHGWFSARMVGLPYIGTVAACAGTMVALTSPNAGAPYHWARVVEHELVHVINLEQTRFRIPHWFTEGLAVWNEGLPRSAAWNRLLAARWREGRVFDLGSINLGFIRPRSSDDWQLAYCQAELYVEFLRERFGPEAPARLLETFARLPDTALAVAAVTGQEAAAFDAEYRRFLARTVAQIRLSETAAPQTLAELERRASATPDDPDVAAALARALLERKEYLEARRWVERALGVAPRHPLASYVASRLKLVTGERETALALAEPALDLAAPDLDLLRLVAGLKLQGGDLAAAEQLYRLGAERAPDDPDWRKRLAAVYLRTGDDPRLRGELEYLASADGDDLVVRKKLAQLALAAGDGEAARRWATEAVFVNVQDPLAHRLLAEALVRLADWPAAAREWRALAQLEPAVAAHRRSWVEALRAQGDLVGARRVLDEALAAHPDDPDLNTLRESLPP